MRRIHFDTPHQEVGKPAKSRFGLRPQIKPAKKQPADDNTFRYANPGKGPNGESSN